MFLLTSEKQAAFENQALLNYIDELVEHCHEFAPNLATALGEKRLKTALQLGIKKAETQGFTQRGTVRFYIDMMILFGGGFDNDPQFPWVASTLKQDFPEQMDKADKLHAQSLEYFNEVHGKENQYRLVAISKLEKLNLDNLEINAKTFSTDILALMGEVYPQKFKVTSQEHLRELIGAGIRKGQNEYELTQPNYIALIVIMMFMLGHRYDANPFHPWVSKQAVKGQFDNEHYIDPC
jgi:hypothetical protein